MFMYFMLSLTFVWYFNTREIVPDRKTPSKGAIMESYKEKEKVLVPVRRQEITQKEESPDRLPEKENEPKVWKLPRRWLVR